MLGLYVEDLFASAVITSDIINVEFVADEKYKGGESDNPWLVLFFYPADFTFVCPTELRELKAQHSKFQASRANVWGISTDSVYVHKEWIKKVFESNMRYPLVDDRNGMLSDKFGFLHYETGMAKRGTVVLDPSGQVRYYAINDDSVGRSVTEILRVLSALQAVDANEGHVACEGWTEGDGLVEV